MTTRISPKPYLSFVDEAPVIRAGSLRERLQDVMPLLESFFGLADPSLWAHCMRVGKMARETGELLGMKAATLDEIEVAGYLHDIGRVVHSDLQLHQPLEVKGPLDTDNAAHCLRSTKIVSSLPWLSPLMPTVLFHHERWDGSGAPAGLRGEAIPLPARIVAVVDTFDRMVGGSAPGTEQPINLALETIRNGRDRLYDPDVVNAFIDACGLSLTRKHLWGRPHLDLNL